MSTTVVSGNVFERSLPAAIHSESLGWYAMMTHSRHENKVHKLLQEKSFECFLPLVSEVRQWKDRKQRVDIPLFSNYLFVRADMKSADRLRILGTPGVLQIVSYGAAPARVPCHEIDTIRAALACTSCKAHPTVMVGQRVKVLNGCLSGVEGRVIRSSRPLTIAINIGSIHQAISVQLDGFEVCAV